MTYSFHKIRDSNVQHSKDVSRTLLVHVEKKIKASFNFYWEDCIFVLFITCQDFNNGYSRIKMALKSVLRVSTH